MDEMHFDHAKDAWNFAEGAREHNRVSIYKLGHQSFWTVAWHPLER